MWIDIMEIDAGQYASMAQEMIKTGDFFHFVDRGEQYLDKPPLIFWMTVLSFKAFGISTFTYKLPSLLMAILAIYSIYRLAIFLYNERTGILAALVLASCQAFFLMNNDVKTDMYMIGPMTFALWQLVVFARGGKWWTLQLGFAGLAFAMLGKGPIGVVAPLLGMGADFVIRRDWKGLFRRPWLLGLPIFALILLPFSIGLHQQFGWKGVEFFFWTQSFGRITGSSEWQNDASPLFFVHTFLWSFLPWSIIMIGAFARKTWQIVRGRVQLPSTSEAISLGGFTLLFLALSTSRFKLPHYIFVAYPFAALLTANFLDELLEIPTLTKWKRIFTRLHIFEGTLSLILPLILMIWAFPDIAIQWTMLYILFVLGLGFWFYKVRDSKFRLVIFLTIAFSLGNFYMNLALYPQILTYQSSSQVGKYLHSHAVSPDLVYGYNVGGRALDFYAGAVAHQLENPNQIGKEISTPIYVYTDEKGLSSIKSTKIQFKTLLAMPDFRVGKLSLPFINPAIRPKLMGERYLIHIP